MSNKKFKPTSYIVIFWNGDSTEKVKEEIYPMHQYSLDDVLALLKGKEVTCDIYEGRYWKDFWVGTANVNQKVWKYVFQ